MQMRQLVARVHLRQLMLVVLAARRLDIANATCVITTHRLNTLRHPNNRKYITYIPLSSEEDRAIPPLVTRQEKISWTLDCGF